MQILKNRWIILFAGVLIQIILGGIYAWSTFSPRLLNEYYLSKGESGLIFGTTIITFTIVMIFAGRLYRAHGPKITAGIGAVLFGAGYFLSSFSNGSFSQLLLSIGILSGSGIGFGYVCPLSTGMKWFPKNKGLVTGVAVAGFGGGAVLLSSIANSFLGNTDVLVFFRYYGIVSMGILFIASSFLAVPEGQIENDTNAALTESLSASILTPAFFLTVIGMFSGTFAGLMIIGNLSLIIKSGGYSATGIVHSISLFSIGNAAGRLSWGVFYDKAGYLCMPLSLLNIAIPALLLLVPVNEALMYAAVTALGFRFGANFVVYAAVISDYFGVHSFVKIYPICFLAYGIAGLIGPGAGGTTADITGSYHTAIILSTALLFITALMTGLKLPVLQKREHKAGIF